MTIQRRTKQFWRCSALIVHTSSLLSVQLNNWLNPNAGIWHDSLLMIRDTWLKFQAIRAQTKLDLTRLASFDTLKHLVLTLLSHRHQITQQLYRLPFVRSPKRYFLNYYSNVVEYQRKYTSVMSALKCPIS